MAFAVPARRRLAIGTALLVSLVSLAAAGKAVLYDTLDPDCFLHLLAADQLLSDGIGPIHDRQSFASVRSPWVPYAWLAELGMKAVWDAGGYRAAVAAQALMAAMLVGLVAMSCVVSTRSPADEQEDLSSYPFEESDNPVGPRPVVSRVAAVSATALAAFLSMPYLSFRPMTAALVILALCQWLLVRDRRMGERSLAVWFVVPLTALTINLHLYAVAIPLFVCAMFLGALWERRGAYEPPDWPEADRRARRYGMMMLWTTLACLATPMLPSIPAAFVHMQANPIVSSTVIAEYQPFYRGPMGQIAAGGVALLLLCVLANRRRVRAGEVFLLLVTFALLMRMGRFAPVFAVAAAPAFAQALPRFTDRLLARPAFALLVLMAVGSGVWRVGSVFPRSGETLEKWVNRHGPGAPGYPCAAAEFVEKQIRPVTGRLINEYSWGGYLEWRLGDRFLALLDGRTNCFTAEFWRVTYLSGEDARRDFFSRIRADVAILPASDSRFRQTLVDLGWTVAYRDDRAEVLIPPPHSARAAEPIDWHWAAARLGAEE